MSNIKRYRCSVDEIEIVLDVDLDILTPELATEINGFWTEAEWRIVAADDDVVKAVIRLAAQSLVCLLLEDLPGDIRAAMVGFRELEGWPERSGIELVDFDGIPDFDSIDFDVAEVER